MTNGDFSDGLAGWNTSGILVDLSLEVHNRYDRFYNTYVLVDDVRVEVRD